MVGLILTIASLVVCYIFLQKLIKAIASKNMTKQHIIITVILFVMALVFALMFVLDLTVFHSPAFLRVSQILAGAIFIACATLLTVLAATKYSPAKFIKPVVEKKGKKK